MSFSESSLELFSDIENTCEVRRSSGFLQLHLLLLLEECCSDLPVVARASAEEYSSAASELAFPLFVQQPFVLVAPSAPFETALDHRQER